MDGRQINRICMTMKYSGKAQRHREQKIKNAKRRDASRKKIARRMDIIEYVGYNPNVGWIKSGYGGAKYIAYYSGNSKLRRSLKKQTTKKARRSELPSKGNAYRKTCEYRWQLW